MKRLAVLLYFPLAIAAAPNDPPSLEQSLDATIASRFRPDLPGVAALVVKDGKPLLRKGYGMANLELGVPVRPEHVFRIGSTTKLFTATAVMLLVDEGRIALDAPVSRYLPDAPQYKAVGALGMDLGLEWGGSWKGFVDQPHFQLRPAWAGALTDRAMLAELRRRHDEGAPVYA